MSREYTRLFPKLGDRTRVIYSMPILVCEFGRAHFSKCFKGEASYGRCPSKKQIYFGFKFNALTTVDCFLTDYVITPANVDYRNAVWDLFYKYSSISIIGDKGYVNKRLTPKLKGEKGINLLFLKRGNSKENYPKFITRTSIKVLAHNISFLINKLMGKNDSLAKIKELVFG